MDDERSKRKKRSASADDVDESRWLAHRGVNWNAIKDDDTTIGGLIKLAQQFNRQNKGLHATEHLREFRFTARARRLAADGHILEIIYGVLRHLITNVSRKAKDNFMQMILDSPSELDYGVFGVVRPVNPDFHLYDFMERLERVLTSKSNLTLSHSFRLTVRIIELPNWLKPVGALLLRKHCRTFLEYLFAKKATWSPGGIGGKDCLIKCVAAGLQVQQKGLKKARKESWWYSKGAHRALQAKAEEIANETGLPLDQRLNYHDFYKVLVFYILLTACSYA